MGVLVFRDGNFGRLKEGVISGGDLLGLDRDKDRELIGWLLSMVGESKREKIMRRYGVEELPPATVNIDDPEDQLYRTYYVLLEQVMRESSSEVLKKAAFGNRRESIGRFAFCRLTGFAWPAGECDAYSYRTWQCGLKKGVTRKEIEDFCREMTERHGPFENEARAWLHELPLISDGKLEEWAKGDTERKDPSFS